MENVLEIQGLRKEYEGFTLKDVSFHIPRGYIMGLIGPNGAGKTTVIKLIMNVIAPDAGEIRVFGLDNRKDEVAIKSRIGFVYETPDFYNSLSLRRIKSVIAPFYAGWDDGLFHSLAAKFDLPLKKAFRKLSRGMKMKFSLALALSHGADLIIMDEPTSGLDPVFRRELLKLLSGFIQDEGKSVLFSTHITSDLEKIADYVTFIRKGEIVFSSAKDEIMENWAIVKGGNELLDDESRLLFRGVRRSEFGFEALTSDVGKARRHFHTEVLIEKASLEDIMFFVQKGNGSL